ncbi:cytochrome P450 3A11 [Nephila pilipes]|uniref:Cytochrome P450 3A11 n=1 Tax=Nephila pilipes TaxID=299642 RepID=A0A8X6MN63_NEPPI|nr:cytochrome P450 3A11 [Nephila pilipes]
MYVTELFTGTLLISFSIGITSVLFLYWYYTRNFDYWKKKGIPYAEAVPFFGSTYSLLWKPFHEIELERHLKYGPLYGFTAEGAQKRSYTTFLLGWDPGTH